MSMISAQCDELRKAAQTYRTLGGYEMEQTLLDAADTITELRGALLVASVDYRHLSEENAKLRELATYALRHIVEVWCDGEGRDLYRGKPCEDCADAFSSDCPKCMPRMFDVSGIEVDG